MTTVSGASLPLLVRIYTRHSKHGSPCVRKVDGSCQTLGALDEGIRDKNIVGIIGSPSLANRVRQWVGALEAIVRELR